MVIASLFGMTVTLGVCLASVNQKIEVQCNCTSTEVFENLDDLCNFLEKPEKDPCCVMAKIVEVGGPFALNCSVGSGGRKILGLDFSKADVRSLDAFHGEDRLFPNLRELDLSENSKLPFEAFTNVSANILGKIANLSVGGVNMGGGFEPLSRLLGKMPRLESLDVSKCNLSRINLSLIASQNPKINKINLAGNSLMNVTFNKEVLEQLIHVNLSRCGLKNLLWEGKRVLPKSSLQEVDLSSNGLATVPEFFIKAVKDTKFLDIRGNSLDGARCASYFLWEMVFTSEHDDEANFKVDNAHPSRPSLENCTWEDCPFECQCHPENKTVDCSNRDLSEVPKLGPSEATTILLQNNKLGDYGARSLFMEPPWCQLEVINLDNNNITQLMEDVPMDKTCTFHRLRNLSLADNNLSTLGPNDWYMIRMGRRVNLSRNQLSLGSFEAEDNVPKDYTRIESLDLSFNKLSSSILTDKVLSLFPFLEELDLSNNNIKTVNISSTSMLPKLRVFNLNTNSLKDLKLIPPVRKGFFRGSTFLPDVKALHLGNNELTTVSVDSLYSTLVDVTLEGNPWNCSDNYTLISMQTFLLMNLSPDVAKAFHRLRCADDEMVISRESVGLLINMIDFRRQSFYEFKFSVFVVCFVFLIAFLICFATPLWKQVCFWCTRNSTNRKTAFHKKKFDIFIYYCLEDSDLVEEMVLPELYKAGYSLIHPGDFIFGYGNMEQVLHAMEDSRRMIVFVSDNFLHNEQSLYALQLGIEREHKFENFFEAETKKMKEDCEKGCLKKSMPTQCPLFNFEVAAVYLKKDVRTPDQLSAVLKQFLLVKTLKMGIYDSKWLKNLSRFIGPASKKQRSDSDFSLPESCSTSGVEKDYSLEYTVETMFESSNWTLGAYGTNDVAGYDVSREHATTNRRVHNHWL